MLKWFSGEEGEPGAAGAGSPLRPEAPTREVAVEEMAERLAQTEQLLSQLKMMIREKDAALNSKDEQLKMEKESCEAKLSKLRLQNEARVTSLNTQLEELKKQQGVPLGSPTHSKKGSSEGEQASRGKIVVLKKKVEELEQQLAQRQQELGHKTEEVESQKRRGEEMDAMLVERDRKLAEKEAYIIHLQTALAGDTPTAPPQAAAETDKGASLQELQPLVQQLNRKVEEWEERCALLQEQVDGLKTLLNSEQERYSQKESMYEKNIQTFKDIILQKEEQLTQVNQQHEQELFKLAAKSDASADLEQLLKALKQKLHEKEEVLLGKTQVIDVLQGEVDGRDLQIKELMERLRRLQVERESLASRMEAEKHVMRAQLRDLMDKQQAEAQRLSKEHQEQLAQSRQDLLVQLEELRSASTAPPAGEEASRKQLDDSGQTVAELEAQLRQKTEEASRSEAKFLKTKAWSKTRIRQLEEELRKSQAGDAPPELTALRNRVTELEAEREENAWRVERYEELRAQNDALEAKLVAYEEQQRTLQADLEQVAKRAASQASESGSADDAAQCQVLEWQEMVSEAVSARDQAREERATMALRISHMEEEREALETRQQELEEELAQAQVQGLGRHRAKKSAAPSQRSLQEDFEFDGQAQFQEGRGPSESTTPMEGENMGGWWPEQSAPDTGGLRSVVEELELERNQLQEQILSLEERCQDLEDRLQLQARIEALQNETEKLQNQLSSVRSQQSRDAEKHQLLVGSLNEQLRGLTNTQESLESSLLDKENTLAKTSEKLELISSLGESLSQKELQLREVSEKLLQTELSLEKVSQEGSRSEKQCSELRAEVADLTHKLSALKEKTQKQEVTAERLQSELDQAGEELEKLNASYLEERAQLIHDLQSCERQIDSLKEVLQEKDKEISTLSSNAAEYAEQLAVLKQELRLKEENLLHVETALSKAELEASVMRESQSSDQRARDEKMTELLEKLTEAETELLKSREEKEAEASEVQVLVRQAQDDKKTIQELRAEVQRHAGNHRSHLTECQSHVTSLKEQLAASSTKLLEAEGREQTYSEELRTVKEEQQELLAQVDKYKAEVQSVTRHWEEKAQAEVALFRKETQERLETINRLETQLKAADDEKQGFSSELSGRRSEEERMSSEIRSKTEAISKLEHLLNESGSEKSLLQDKLKGAMEELQQQQQSARDLGEKVGDIEQQLHLLTQQRELLQEQLRTQEQTAAEVGVEKMSLQDRITTLETQLSQSSSSVRELQDDKERLTELNRVLEQSSHSGSQTLLEKTEECSRLSQSLSEAQHTLQSLTSEAQQVQQDAAERQQTTDLLQAQTEAQQKQLAELQGTVDGLRAELTQKEEVLSENLLLQSEVGRQKSVISELQAEAERLRDEHTRLVQQVTDGDKSLRDATLQCEKHQEELSDTSKKIQTLSKQIKAKEKNSRRLEAEAQQRLTELQAETEQRLQLLAVCQAKELQLSQQAQAVSDLQSQLSTTLESNSELGTKIDCLTGNQLRLEEQLAQSVTETTSLREQAAEHRETIAGLLGEKEALTLTAGQLKKLLEDHEASSAAGLLERSSQCDELSARLARVEEELRSAQQQVEGLTQQIRDLNLSLGEREQTVSEQRQQLEARRQEAEVLQERLGEATQQHSRAAQMQVEAEQALAEVTRQLEEQKEELEKRNRSVESLSSQHAAANQRATEAEATITSLTMTGQELSAEKCRQEEQSAILAGELRGKILELDEQRDQLKSELQRTAADFLKAQREAAELKQAHLERESLQRQEDSLKQQQQQQQQQDVIQRLSSRIAEQDEQLAQKAEDNSSLRAKVAELQDSVDKLGERVNILTSESSSLRSRLEQKEQASLEEQTSSSAKVQSLSTALHAQEAECNGLKEQVTHLEESVAKLSASLQVQVAEAEHLRRALEDKDVALSQQRLSLQESQRRADEAALFKTQFAESTELVTELQTRLQSLHTELEDLRRSAGETQSAFNNLQEKYAANLEELTGVRERLSQSAEEASQLQKMLDDAKEQGGNAESLAETLRSDISAIRQKLEQTEGLNSGLMREKDEALEAHRASVSLLTVEIDRLKSQHLQVASQMNSLTENLEQREMALHAINSQYTLQARHASQLAAKTQQLEEQNRQLDQENARLREEGRELEVKQQQTSSAEEEASSQKKSLQAQVSAKDQELCELRENVGRMEQVLQDSEKEWLLVLDREKQEKKLLAEQLQSNESQLKFTGAQVDTLKRDLGSLQDKFAEASSAVGQSSTQLEEALASIQKQEQDNSRLHKTLEAAKRELRQSESQSGVSESEKLTDLPEMIRELRESHERQVHALEGQLDERDLQLARVQERLEEEKQQSREKSQQLALSQQTVEDLEAAVARARGDDEEQRSGMSIQISQQKELLSALSQQLRDKDAAVAQVMESAAGERLKLGEEKASLAGQLASMELKAEASEKRNQELLLQQEEHLSQLKSGESEKLLLLEERDNARGELATACRERDAIKKKLQAALLARKELMKKLEHLERETEEKDRQEVSHLQEQLQELACRGEEAAKIHQDEMSILEQKLREEADRRSEHDSALEQLRVAVKDAEAALAKVVQEKQCLVEQLHTATAEREEAESSWLQELAALRKEIQSCRDQLELEKASSSSAVSSAVALEEELAQLKREKASLQKKAQAALVARRTTAKNAEENDKKLRTELDQLKDDYKALLEQHCQQTNLLNATQTSLDQKVRQLEELQEVRASEMSPAVAQKKEEEDSLSEGVQKTEQVKNHQDAAATTSFKEENILLQELKEKDEALTEKDELTPAPEVQLQQQMKIKEAAVERVELQKSPDAETGGMQQDNQSKTVALTKKLQAALVSRRQLAAENAALKEEVANVTTRCEAKEAEVTALELSLTHRREQQVELQRTLASLEEEKKKLIAEVDGMLGDNRNLTAACDSLKLTIENITQQKQAFSCQMEALRDSQAGELSKWKSEHAELKQEYESLLQAYENVGGEMDKMRQLLEVAKRDRQEALRKVHRLEGELETLEKKARYLEEENCQMKEQVPQFSEEERRKMEDLEEESRRSKQELAEIQERCKAATEEMASRNQVLETEACGLRERLEELREKLGETDSINQQLAEELKKSSHLYQEKLKVCSSTQVNLSEALSQNISLTAQIEAQKAELGVQVENCELLQRETQSLTERTEQIRSDCDAQLAEKDTVVRDLRDMVSKHDQEMVSLKETVRILEDDKSLLQEELENAQEISDKVKNENEYLETVVLKNSERIDELTNSVALLQTQNAQLSSQLAADEDLSGRLQQEKEEEHLKLVREFEEKLKTYQRGSEGSKNVNKELQELLKEKHQEISQLQQNCVKYQEVILDLDNSSKTLQEELRKGSEKTSTLADKHSQAEAELVAHKSLLQQAHDTILRVESERDQLALDLAQRDGGKSERRRAAERGNPFHSEEEELSTLRRQLEELRVLRDQEAKRVEELRRQVESRDVQVDSLQRATETSQAKLAALCAAPEGSAADENWDSLFGQKLQEKDQQLLEHSMAVQRLLQEARAKDEELSALRAATTRLQVALDEHSMAAAAHQRQLLVAGASNAELAEGAELAAVRLKELGARVDALERDKRSLGRQLAERDSTLAQAQLKLQQAEKVSADSEARLLKLRADGQALAAEAEKQDGVRRQLTELLRGKDAEIATLLSSGDGQLTGYLEQLQANQRSQAAVYEDRLASSRYQREKIDGELRRLEAEVESLRRQLSGTQQEKEQAVTAADSLRSSMASLQSERERLMSENRVLEAKSQLVLAGSSGGKGLKHEIRKLLHQMDDLNSENAMLRAQLLRYREDLNQVLSLKDNQLKALLKKQQDVIRSLEDQKVAAERQHRDARLELRREEEAGAALRAEISRLTAPGVELRGEDFPQETQETKVEMEAELARVEQERAAGLKVTQKITEQQQQTTEESLSRSGLSEKEVSSKRDLRSESDREKLTEELRRCVQQLQERDQYLQQLGTKFQQVAEEKNGVAAQLRAVSQTLRDSQQRCYWLEGQLQLQSHAHSQGSVYTEVAPGAPQEKNDEAPAAENTDVSQLRERLLEAEQRLAEELLRRESAEEALRVHVDAASRDTQRDFSIDMEVEDEWDGVSIDPNQPLVAQKVSGGVLACRRWLRGRSLYFSRLLTGRARSRHLFLAYLLLLHGLVLLCLSGAL